MKLNQASDGNSSINSNDSCEFSDNSDDSICRCDSESSVSSYDCRVDIVCSGLDCDERKCRCPQREESFVKFNLDPPKTFRKFSPEDVRKGEARTPPKTQLKTQPKNQPKTQPKTESTTQSKVLTSNGRSVRKPEPNPDETPKPTKTTKEYHCSKKDGASTYTCVVVKKVDCQNNDREDSASNKSKSKNSKKDSAFCSLNLEKNRSSSVSRNSKETPQPGTSMNDKKPECAGAPKRSDQKNTESSKSAVCTESEASTSPCPSTTQGCPATSKTSTCSSLCSIVSVCPPPNKNAAPKAAPSDKKAVTDKRSSLSWSILSLIKKSETTIPVQKDDRTKDAGPQDNFYRVKKVSSKCNAICADICNPLGVKKSKISDLTKRPSSTDAKKVALKTDSKKKESKTNLQKHECVKPGKKESLRCVSTCSEADPADFVPTVQEPDSGSKKGSCPVAGPKSICPKSSKKTVAPKASKKSIGPKSSQKSIKKSSKSNLAQNNSKISICVTPSKICITRRLSRPNLCPKESKKDFQKTGSKISVSIKRSKRNICDSTSDKNLCPKKSKTIIKPTCSMKGCNASGSETNLKKKASKTSKKPKVKVSRANVCADVCPTEPAKKNECVDLCAPEKINSKKSDTSQKSTKRGFFSRKKSNPKKADPKKSACSLKSCASRKSVCSRKSSCSFKSKCSSKVSVCSKKSGKTSMSSKKSECSKTSASSKRSDCTQRSDFTKTSGSSKVSHDTKRSEFSKKSSVSGKSDLTKSSRTSLGSIKCNNLMTMKESPSDADSKESFVTRRITEKHNPCAEIARTSGSIKSCNEKPKKSDCSPSNKPKTENCTNESLDQSSPDAPTLVLCDASTPKPKKKKGFFRKIFSRRKRKKTMR